MKKLLCWIKGLWRSWEIVIGGSPHTMSGHTFQEVEKHENVTVEIGKCVDCGEVDITWHKDNIPTL